jgi:hypothetical protein
MRYRSWFGLCGRAALFAGACFASSAHAQFTDAPCKACLKAYEEKLPQCSFTRIGCTTVITSQTLIYTDESAPWSYWPTASGATPTPMVCSNCCPVSLTGGDGELEPNPHDVPCGCSSLPSITCAPSPPQQSSTRCITLTLGASAELDGTIIIGGISFTSSDEKCVEIVHLNPCQPFQVPPCHTGRWLTRSRVTSKEWKVELTWKLRVTVTPIDESCNFGPIHDISPCGDASYVYVDQNLQWESVHCGDLRRCGTLVD